MTYNPFVVWTFWIAFFLVAEGVGIWHEDVGHGGDGWTFTHYLASHMPVGLRVALLAWLAYHFLVKHITG